MEFGEFAALALNRQSAEGIATMLAKGRTPIDVRSVVRDIARNHLGDDLAENEAVNKIFRLMKELDDPPAPTNVGNRFWGDLGKYIGTPGFLRGSHRQLEVVDDLREAPGDHALEALEEGFSNNGVWRYVGIVADSSRHFENQIDVAIDAASRGDTKLLPDVGEVVAFQGRGVPY